ncbi:MAG: hypothetical protein DHS20C02_19880 [Micavibrio sp.]|nr:MAG: hypothetical protein DHS20C02_19880 [Micavibrio sp.]
MRIFKTLFVAALFVLVTTPVFAVSCKDVQTTSEMCLHDPYCEPKLDSGSVVRPTYDNGRAFCNEETHTLVKVSSVDNACETAKDLRQPLNCAQSCAPGNMSENATTDAKCCSIVSERTCSAAAAGSE